MDRSAREADAGSRLADSRLLRIPIFGEFDFIGRHHWTARGWSRAFFPLDGNELFEPGVDYLAPRVCFCPFLPHSLGKPDSQSIVSTK